MLQTVQHTKLPQSESERKSDPYQHQKSSDDDQYKPDQPFAGELLPEHEVRKRDGDEDAQFINRNDDARKPVMQGFVIAEPWSTCCNAGKADKAKFPPRNAT